MKVAADLAPAVREQFMRVALTMAERGMAAGGPPVGACLVRGTEVVASGHNAVISDLDVTAHAEVAVIRSACRELRTLDLAGCALFVTVEPCLMCLAASYYAGINEICYGASLEDMQAVTGAELSAPVSQVFADQPDAPRITGGILDADCRALLETWGMRQSGRVR
ncbi:MAG: nucleoside deaminase [Gammaproteobacteria bacterium]|jgi:tRNA(Arg) A34 adenosine deaminase TadA|nr:nucleoside deaminase [Gammaproteobacteria bacterium]MDP6617724.1 nucleoside deaminase [Gammaproteobacteria bacterium]MDP6694110.1 nucleoside deaminase [Gammaproteobacteria bacterium]MDP7041848.1 nucleoside deaminase [Gammaproteobacteria bacterium]